MKYQGHEIVVRSDNTWEVRRGEEVLSSGSAVSKGDAMEQARDFVRSQHPPKYWQTTRVRRGESHPKTSLTERLVYEIRHGEYKDISSVDLGPMLGCSASTIRNVRLRRSWDHVA